MSECEKEREREREGRGTGKEHEKKIKFGCMGKYLKTVGCMQNIKFRFRMLAFVLSF